MKERLLKFIHTEKLSSAKFAEIVGVQPSSISHILSGRNKPSFDFIVKVLSGFPSINAEWLILGKGEMYKSSEQPTLFSQLETNFETEGVEKPLESNISDQEKVNTEILKPEPDASTQQLSEIEKIVIFYSDKSFKEYSPK